MKYEYELTKIAESFRKHAEIDTDGFGGCWISNRKLLEASLAIYRYINEQTEVRIDLLKDIEKLRTRISE